MGNKNYDNLFKEIECEPSIITGTFSLCSNPSGRITADKVLSYASLKFPPLRLGTSDTLRTSGENILPYFKIDLELHHVCNTPNATPEINGTTMKIRNIRSPILAYSCGGVRMPEEEVIGVTYPIPKQFMDRFFKGKDVFVKPATVWRQLKPGMKFVFYQSHEDTGFVGEAKIKRVVLSENPTKFLETYGDRIFLTREELKDYIKSQERWGKRESKKKKLWMAIELEEIKKYDKTVKPKRFVPVGGQYLRK